jgi:hypothetical protein
MIEKSSAASFTLATIAILGQPPSRWVVERTLGWPNHSRRLSKNYEYLTWTDGQNLDLRRHDTHYVEAFDINRSFQTVSEKKRLLCRLLHARSSQIQVKLKIV